MMVCFRLSKFVLITYGLCLYHQVMSMDQLAAVDSSTDVPKVMDSDRVDGDSECDLHQGEDMSLANITDTPELLTTPEKNTTDSSDTAQSCPAGRWAGLTWPETSVGVTVSLKCPHSSGHARRLCRLRRFKLPIIGEVETAMWDRPDTESCEDTWGDVLLAACQRDTSYATTWPETPINSTATARCPRNLRSVTGDGVTAIRRCTRSVVGGKRVAEWQPADLTDCIATAINSSFQDHSEYVQQALEEWLANNSCDAEVVTTSVSGCFEWNTTVIGGTSFAPCTYGFILPPRKGLDFVRASLSVTSTLHRLQQTIISSVNISEKVNEARSSFGENLIELIANRTTVMVEGAVALDWNQTEVLNSLHEWLELATVLIPEAGGFTGDSIPSRRSNKKAASSEDYFLWMMDSSVLSLDLPAQLIVTHTPEDATRRRLTYDLRGFDPLGTAIDDLRECLTSWYEESSASAKWYAAQASNGDLSTIGQESKPGWDLMEFIGSIEFPNITKIVDVFKNMTRPPIRKCEERSDGEGVAWEDAETWMCRSENGTFSQDLNRALKECRKFGLESAVDLSFVKIILNLWYFVDSFTSNMPQATVAIVQVINYLLALPGPLLPQLVNNRIIMKVEEMANQPLPENVSGLRIVTENMVIDMEQIEQKTFDGVLFASIKPADKTHDQGKKASPSKNDSNIGNNAFKHIDGALNDSLQSLDLESVDEYFYVPETIFTHLPTHLCEGCDGPSGPSPPANMSTLQFVIYENDQLFRTDSGKVSVLQPGRREADWQVASRVISASLGGHRVRGLDSPVVFNLKHHNNIQNTVSRMCVFWDFSARGGLGAWSTEGCSVTSASRDHTVCECTHLTNYAVIIDIWDQLGRGGLSTQHRLALEVLSYVGCSLSLVGLITTMAMLISIGKLREAKTTPTRLMLCLSLVLSMTFYLTGMDRTTNQDACTAFACCIHYFTLVALCWMGVEGVYLYRNIVIVTIGPSRHLFRNCCMVAWGLPAILVGFVAVFDIGAYGNEERCWISKEAVFFTTFLAPALLIVAFNVVIFTMVIWVVCRRPLSGAHRYVTGKEKRELTRRRKEILGIVSLTAVLGLTWIFGSFSVGDGVRVTSLYLFTIFNSAQGFFIFLFYGVVSCASARGGIRFGPAGLTGRDTAGRRLEQFVWSTVALNRKILQLQLCRSGSESGMKPTDSPTTSCSDVQLNFGKDSHSSSSTSDPEKSVFSNPSKTACNFILSAGILHTENLVEMLCLDDRKKQCTVWLESEASPREVFVVGTGIIFCGKP